MYLVISDHCRNAICIAYTLQPPERNGRHLAADLFICNSLNANVWDFSEVEVKDQIESASI